MTKIKTLLIFFALVFGFCAFSDGVWDGPVRVCSELECNSLKQYLNMIYRLTNETYNDIDRKRQDLGYANSNIKRYVSNLDTDQTGLLEGLSYETGSIDTLVTQMGYSINYWNATSGGYGTQFREYIDHIDCTLCANGQCIDLTVVTNILQQVHNLNTNILSLTSVIETSFGSVTNQLRLIRNSVYDIDDNTFSILQTLEDVYSYMGYLSDIYDSVSNSETYLREVYLYIHTYLPKLDSLPLIATNLNVSSTFLDQGYLSEMFWHAMVMEDSSDAYHSVFGPSDWSVPYGYSFGYDIFPLYSYIVSGFANLMETQVSLNNYFYWLREHLLAFSASNDFSKVVFSNDLSKIEEGIACLTNIAQRIDSYVYDDFSNKFYDVWRDIGSLVSNSVYSASIASNLNVIVDGVNTNNLYLFSIDSKLDVLDYIKILSTTPLSAYTGEVDYYDYLTNLYLNGSASSDSASTNWFERIEILLASLVFGDSDNTNDIPQSVEMDGVTSSQVESALTDFTYTQEFTGAINALDDTRQSFIGVLNGLHTSIKSVSLPASISIGLGGLDGEDTHDFNDMMHGHFQVSFNTGIADRFTIAVRAVTTISWVLLFFLALWKSGFYLIRKLVYFYRLVTRLLVSVFTR